NPTCTDPAVTFHMEQRSTRRCLGASALIRDARERGGATWARSGRTITWAPVVFHVEQVHLLRGDVDPPVSAGAPRARDNGVGTRHESDVEPALLVDVPRGTCDNRPGTIWRVPRGTLRMAQHTRARSCHG